MRKTKLIGLDCGESESGVVIIINNSIDRAMNVSNDEVFEIIMQEGKSCTVVIEDVRPYNMRITDGIIQTIKFIGRLEWRLKEAGIKYVLIPRWEVKKWVFLNFSKMVLEEIDKKIDYSIKRKKSKGEQVGKRRKPHFVWVDDRIVHSAMKILWNIYTPKVGQKSEYGLSSHSWQALGVASRYIWKDKPVVL